MSTARSDLNTLEASGLVQVAAMEPELEYLFRHALVQDAAYSSLLKQDRRVLHRGAAETLLALYPDRTRELAGIIAMHFERAGDLPAAAEHLVVAGEHALERFANRDAYAFFERAEASFPPDDRRVDLRLRAALGAARSSMTFGPPDENVARLEAAAAIGDANGDRTILADIYFLIAFLRRLRSESSSTSPQLQRALDRVAELGAASGDPVGQAIPNAFMGVGMIFSGQLRQGAQVLSEALPAITKRADPASAAILTGLLALAYARLGEFELAERTLGLQAAVASGGDPIAALDVDIVQSALLVERGDIEPGGDLAARCAVRSEELGAIACGVSANVVSGTAHLARDDAFGAKAPLERGKELSRVSNMSSFQTLAEAMLGTVRSRLGDAAAGNAGWDLALARAAALRDTYGEAMTRWQRARTRADEGSPDDPTILEDIDAALRLFEEMEAAPAIARALRDRGHILRALGRPADADASDERSRAIAAELGLKDFAAR